MLDELHRPTTSSLNGNAGGLQPYLDELVEHASRPLQEAQALPGAFYTNGELYDYEVDRIFRHDWVYVARLDEMPEPGSWRAVDVGGEAIMLVRGDDGVVRALSRVCPHRFMDVLGGTEEHTGRAESFVCPVSLMGV